MPPRSCAQVRERRGGWRQECQAQWGGAESGVRAGRVGGHTRSRLMHGGGWQARGGRHHWGER
eukprot:6569140-Prorocentrum_lima.AAC.1